jgi:hypothetical protein
MAIGGIIHETGKREVVLTKELAAPEHNNRVQRTSGTSPTSAVIANHKARHRILPPRSQENHIIDGVVTQPGPEAEIGSDQVSGASRTRFSLAS